MSRRHPPLPLETSLVSSLIECLPDAVWLVSPQDLRVVVANSAAARLFELDSAELIGRHAQELCSSIEDNVFWQEVAQWQMGQLGLVGEPAIESETMIRRFDGVMLPVMRRVRSLNLQSAQPYFMVMAQDRSEQQVVQKDLEDRLSELAATIDASTDGILVTDAVGRVRNFNQHFAALWSIPQELMVRRDDNALVEWLQARMVDKTAFQRLIGNADAACDPAPTNTIVLRNGRVLEHELMSPGPGGRPLCRVLSFRDVTERIESKRRINTLSSTDSLTGLPNRVAMDECLATALSRAQQGNESFALMVVDLDHFQHINDSLGYDFGDRVLVEVSERLKSCLRQIDVVARLGSDEFIMLLSGIDSKVAEAAARRILKTMAQPFRLGGISFTVTCSIGVALCPIDGLRLEDLMCCAQAALQSAKASGRSSVRLYQSLAGNGDTQKRARQSIVLDHAMRQALLDSRFRVNYQPQVDLRTGCVLGAEALLRWFDPEMGHVSPAEFIPVAEETGFIVELGHWVLNQAVRQASQWHAAGRPLLVSVNVSALQFQQADFVEIVASALHTSQLPARFLELELTESILLQNEHDALDRLETLARMGVKLAIDDFGTGYSSLGYLKKLPINRLKIDQSFLRGLPADQSDVGIVNAVINLGRALDLRIVAEGVETETQRQFLEMAGCEQYQGFLFAPALHVSAFTDRLNLQGLVSAVDSEDAS